jgi:hypothetical protein
MSPHPPRGPRDRGQALFGGRIRPWPAATEDLQGVVVGEAW